MHSAVLLMLKTMDIKDACLLINHINHAPFPPSIQKKWYVQSPTTVCPKMCSGCNWVQHLGWQGVPMACLPTIPIPNPCPETFPKTIGISRANQISIEM